MVDGASSPHQPDTTLRWLIDRPHSLVPLRSLSICNRSISDAFLKQSLPSSAQPISSGNADGHGSRTGAPARNPSITKSINQASRGRQSSLASICHIPAMARKKSSTVTPERIVPAFLFASSSI